MRLAIQTGVACAEYTLCIQQIEPTTTVLFHYTDNLLVNIKFSLTKPEFY